MRSALTGAMSKSRSRSSTSRTYWWRAAITLPPRRQGLPRRAASFAPVRAAAAGIACSEKSRANSPADPSGVAKSSGGLAVSARAGAGSMISLGPAIARRLRRRAGDGAGRNAVPPPVEEHHQRHDPGERVPEQAVRLEPAGRIAQRLARFRKHPEEDRILHRGGADHPIEDAPGLPDEACVEEFEPRVDEHERQDQQE